MNYNVFVFQSARSSRLRSTLHYNLTGTESFHFSAGFVATLWISKSFLSKLHLSDRWVELVGCMQSDIGCGYQAMRITGGDWEGQEGILMNMSLNLMIMVCK